MQTVTPFLWFNRNAEEAVNFYTSLFKNAEITNTTRYGADSPGPEGTVMTMTFKIDGNEFTALNGGPHFNFTPAISFVVKCETQEEVNRYWDALMEGGQAMQCGWLTDKSGITWQIVPNKMFELIQNVNKIKAQKATEAMMKMIKLDIHELQRVFDNA